MMTLQKDNKKIKKVWYHKNYAIRFIILLLFPLVDTPNAQVGGSFSFWQKTNAASTPSVYCQTINTNYTYSTTISSRGIGIDRDTGNVIFPGDTSIETIQIETPGTIVTSNTHSSIGNPTGSVGLGGKIYVVMTSGNYAIFNSTTLALETAATNLPSASNTQGITTDGTYLYVGTYNPSNTAFKYNTSMTMLETWTHGHGTTRAMAYDDVTGYFYIGVASTYYVYDGWKGSYLGTVSRGLGTGDDAFYYGGHLYSTNNSTSSNLRPQAPNANTTCP